MAELTVQEQRLADYILERVREVVKEEMAAEKGRLDREWAAVKKELAAENAGKK